MPSPTSLSRMAARVADPLAELRREMVVWAEPVIADRIWDAYRDRAVGSTFRSLVAVHHRRLWRALILENRSVAEQIRSVLFRDLARAGLSPDIVADIDNDVMEELMDIVFTRFRSSREIAKGCSMVLLSAASSIGAARPMAA